MMMKGLLTPAEVVQWTILPHTFNASNLGSLYVIERSEMVKCFGLPFWEAMVDTLADYSQAEPYDPATVYNLGDAALYNGKYYVATRTTSELPSNVGHWKTAPKFDERDLCAEAYEILYCNFLGPYLAAVAITNKFPYLIAQVSDTGFDYGGRKLNLQDVEAIKEIQTALYRDRERAYQSLMSYVRDPKVLDTGCYAGLKSLWQEHTTVCGCGLSSCTVCNEVRPSHVGSYRWG